VLTRSGVLAYWLKLTQAIPYVVVEHWSRYLPQNFSYDGVIRKFITQKVVKNASALFTVSRLLENAMNDQGLECAVTQRINNVVDDFFFLPQEQCERSKKRILHVSCFDERAKNVCGILRMAKRLLDKRNDFELILVGTGVDYDDTVQYAKMLQLPEDAVRFVGEQTPQQVSDWMHQSDFLLMFSNYETAGVVISESLAAGQPVLSSAVGIVPEVIDNGNGRIVPVDDEDALLEKANWMLDNFASFSKKRITDSAQQFSFSEVGEKLYKRYLQAL